MGDGCGSKQTRLAVACFVLPCRRFDPNQCQCAATGLSGRHDWRRAVPSQDSDDQELIALALETRRVASGVPDAVVRCRLLEIAEDVLRLARYSVAPH